MARALLCLLLLCAACATPASSQLATPEPSEAWITLAQAQQADAPALVATDGALLAVWVGADDRGVHQDARRITPGGLGDVVTLPLPPTHPYDQRLFPGDSAAHLLWLDADETNQTRLYAALLAPDLTVERGPVAVSDGLALDYAAIPDGSGGLWAAWSGGLLAEMTLYARRIDDAGRPLIDTITVAAAAEHPALLRTAPGEIWLFWLEDGQVMRQRLDPSDDSGAQALTGAVSLSSGDRLVNVSAGLDRSSAYFFWNITRADGSNETSLAFGSLAATAWRQPRRLQISAGTTLDLRWAMPLTGASDLLTAVAESDAGLSLITLSAGTIVGYRTVAPGEHLIGTPALAQDAAGSLYLAWASPGDTSAALRLLHLQP
ncbi:MAG: hypothetical protein U0521_12350 [Anaerolineae bacterium]